jgi:ribosomal protein L7/L12
MKKKNIVLSLAMALMIGIGTTAYATTSNSTSGKNFEQGKHFGMGMGKMGNFKGPHVLSDLLKEKGVTDEEIKTALDSGKSLYDLAIEKGITDDQMKEYMIAQGTKHIDEAVTNGKMTAAQAEEAKTKLKEASASFNFKDQGNGMMKGSRGMDGGHSVLSNLLKEKGTTNDEIKSALDSGKSLYDLAIEKGITDDQMKEYMITQGTKHIDEAVTSGKMTADQAEEAKTKLKEASANCNFKNPGNGIMKGFMVMGGGHNILSNLLKETGATDEEIKAALNSGKSLYDFAIEKGITDDQIKEYMITQGTKRIDEAITSRKMTAAQAEEAKTKLKEASANWNFQNKGNGQMKGFMSMEHKSKMGMNKPQNSTTSNQ